MPRDVNGFITSAENTAPPSKLAVDAARALDPSAAQKAVWGMTATFSVEKLRKAARVIDKHMLNAEVLLILRKVDEETAKRGGFSIEEVRGLIEVLEERG